MAQVHIDNAPAFHYRPLIDMNGKPLELKLNADLFVEVDDNLLKEYAQLEKRMRELSDIFRRLKIEHIKRIESDGNSIQCERSC